MIKSLLNAEEETSPKKESVASENFSSLSLNEPPSYEKTVENPLPTETEVTTETVEKSEEATETAETVENAPNHTDENSRDVFEIPEDAKFFAKPETLDDRLETISLMSEEELEKLLEEEDETYKNLTETVNSEAKTEIENTENQPLISSEPVAESPKQESNTMFNFEPETPDETMRKSGLAYSAAIILLASVIFMMILGWFADLLIGSSPWGIVGGIILGGLIGFIQFFRIASSIFKK